MRREPYLLQPAKPVRLFELIIRFSRIIARSAAPMHLYFQFGFICQSKSGRIAASLPRPDYRIATCDI